MAVTLLMLPPQTPTTRAWAARLAAALPQLSVVVAEDPAEAARAVGDVEAAFGTMPSRAACIATSRSRSDGNGARPRATPASSISPKPRR